MKESPKIRQVMEYIYQQINRLSDDREGRLPTEQEIMAHLGVSRSTVSRALKIMKERGAIERVRGRGSFLPPTPAPSATPWRSADFIPLVIPRRFYEVHGVDVLLGAEEQLSSRGCALLPYYVDVLSEKASYEACVELVAAGARVIMIYGPEWFSFRYLFLPLVNQDIRFVFIDSKPPYLLPYDLITSDHRYGGYMAAEHLIGLGHRKIAILSHYNFSSHSFVNPKDRLKGIMDAMRRYGIPIRQDYMVFQRDSSEIHETNTTKILEMARKLLLSEDRPTAMIAPHDYIASFVISIAKEIGLRVPEDLSVIGFDDLAMQEPVTTIRQDFYHIGYKAAEAAYELLSGKREDAVHILVKTTLVKRDTTAPPKG